MLMTIVEMVECVMGHCWCQQHGGDGADCAVVASVLLLRCHITADKYIS